jgi:lipoate-protein ligase A
LADEQSVSLTARHGLITALIFHLEPPLNASTEATKIKQDYLDTLALSLVGRRYGSLEGAEEAIPPDEDATLKDIHQEVVEWLRKAM